MNKINFFSLVLLFILIAYGVLPSQGQQIKSATNTSEHQKMPLKDYLQYLGSKYDLVFTLEEAWQEEDFADDPDLRTKSILGMQYVENFEMENSIQHNDDSVQILLDRARQVIPNFYYELDSKNLRIIHVIDARLKQQKHYGLDSVLTELQFKGTVLDLINTIHKQENLVSYQSGFGVYETSFVDFYTLVDVKGTELTVRDSLTNFLDLTNRCGIIWIAKTKLGYGEKTTVYFRLGPQRSSNK